MPAVPVSLERELPAPAPLRAAAAPLPAAPVRAVPPLPLSVSLVTDLKGLAGLAAGYQELRAVTGNRLPFALHDWHLAWCRHFLNYHPHIEDEPRFCVLHEAMGGCVAILPFIQSRRRFGPLRITSLNMLGADPAITEIPTPLVAPGYGALAVRAARDLFSCHGDWDWIHWSGLNEELRGALSGGPHQSWREPVSDFVLDLPPTWEEFRSGLKRNIRESLRHCYNSLRRAGHRLELQVIADPAGIALGLDRFLELHRMRAELRNTVVHPDRFAAKVSRDFLYEVCERLAQQGVTRLFALRVGGEIVAMRIGFVVDDSLYLYYSGYEPRWARYSVMTTTMAEAIKYAIAAGLTSVNLSPSRDLAKTRWGPRQVDYASVDETRERLHSRLAYRAYRKARDSATPLWLRRLTTGRVWQ
jgi:CelD/BcsL family acetyltransferase involved in cellulose biosynthesis